MHIYVCISTLYVHMFTYIHTSEETGDDSSSAVEFSDDDEGAKQRLKEKVRQMMAKAIGQALAKTVTI